VRIFIPLLLFIFAAYNLSAEKCREKMLLDGSEKLVAYGMDTTQHWWAVTEPFSGRNRLYVDGIQTKVYNSLNNLVFSPDGSRWACFAQDNLHWNLITNDTVLALPGTDVGEIHFSPNSDVLAYSYFDGDLETIIYGDRQLEVYQRFGNYYLNQNGSNIAFTGYRSDVMVINIGGVESTTYDTIIPLGFWNDGNFVYAGRNGHNWQIYKGQKAITEVYSSISEVAINLEGTVAGALVRRGGSYAYGILISDDYWEPLIGKPYELVQNLVLHPTLPMIAYNAMIDLRKLVIFNTVEYAGGEYTGRPSFSFDGSELCFTGCRIDCFVNINGMQFNVQSDISSIDQFAVKPGSKTIAYSTSSSMIIRYLETNDLYAGKMLDAIQSPRYNWRQDRYEALGSINNRLYLLMCSL
jgi:hypothetical protein